MVEANLDVAPPRKRGSNDSNKLDSDDMTYKRETIYIKCQLLQRFGKGPICFCRG